MLLNEVLDVPPDLIADPHGCGIQTEIGMFRVFQIPMKAVNSSGKNRTLRLFPAIAKLDQEGESQPKNSATSFVRCWEMPISTIASIAVGLSSFGDPPALTTSNCSPAILRRKPSAICVRLEFPVQRNRTFCLIMVIYCPASR